MQWSVRSHVCPKHSCFAIQRRKRRATGGWKDKEDHARRKLSLSAQEATRTAHTSTADIGGKRHTKAPQEGKFLFSFKFFCTARITISLQGAKNNITPNDDGYGKRPPQSDQSAKYFSQLLVRTSDLRWIPLLKFDDFLYHRRHSTSTRTNV